jgi:membrane-associated protein
MKLITFIFSDQLLVSLLNYGTWVAYIIAFSFIFAESGLLIGFFLPGDSLLFTAGFLASQGYMNIYILVIGFFFAAVVGDSAGYLFGHKVGKRLFQKENSLLFHKDNLLKAKAFYEKHGGKTIILARFMPMVRTFAPIIAGIGDMHYQTFLMYNLVGAILWAIGLTMAGFFLGRLIPNVDKFLLPIVLAIVFFSVAPTIYHLLKDPNTRRQIFESIKKILKFK